MPPPPPPPLHRRRTALVWALLAGATSLPTYALGQAAQDVSTVGRPSVDTPDACAALPLEWRLRCEGGRNHTVSDIGAPYDSTAYDSTASPATDTPVAWHSQWTAVLPADRAVFSSTDRGVGNGEDEAPVTLAN